MKSVRSQPARAVWIEIPRLSGPKAANNSHSLRGLCGLKSFIILQCVKPLGHSLRGLCGLKCMVGVLFI